MAQFPARTNRTHLIEDLKVGETGTIAGRLIHTGLLYTPTKRCIEDSSISIECTCKQKDFYEHKDGTIVEAKGKKLGRHKFEVEQYSVLTPAPHYDASYNPAFHGWQRAAVDSKTRHDHFDRPKVIRAIREFFYQRGFLEVETPTLVNVPGMEPYLTPFKTQLETSSGDKFPAHLITSPEYAMKKMLVGGMDKIFQITRSYRNQEELSLQHNPEFTLLEWYRAYASYLEIMDDTEQLVAEVAQCIEWIGKEGILKYQGTRINLTPPWTRISYRQALQEYANLAYDEIESVEGLQKALRAKGYTVQSDEWDTLITQVFLNEIEPKLGQDKPCIVYDFPLSQGALAKQSETDPRFAERFEVYIAGIELANAFTELNDPDEQLRRLEEEQELRRKLGKDVYPVDDSFIEALRWGMPPAGGIALGIDRLMMLLLNAKSVGEVIWQPWREMFEQPKA